MADQLSFWPEDQAGAGLMWSVTRDRRLKLCPRRYYLHHFASRGGRDLDAPTHVRELYVLKSLRNRYMWVGEVVHNLIELALVAFRRGAQVPLEGLIERGTRIMRAQYAESVQRLYWERPGQVCGLIEHEYDEPLDRATWREQRDRMAACLRNFFGLPLLERLRTMPPWRYLAIESLSSFSLAGATVLVKPDLAWREPDERVALLDWKTGGRREEDERLQLAVYGLFAQRTWGLGGAPLKAQVVYLADAEVSEMALGRDALKQAEETIRASLERMQALQPHQQEISNAHEERFPKTRHTELCALCTFRRVCSRTPRDA